MRVETESLGHGSPGKLILGLGLGLKAKFLGLGLELLALAFVLNCLALEEITRQGQPPYYINNTILNYCEHAFEFKHLSCQVRSYRYLCHLVKAALHSRCGQYIFVLWFLLSSSFPRLISAVADWMSTILPHMVWP